MAKREVNMLSGSIVKGLLTISIPILIQNVGQSLFNIIDLAIMKMYGDKLAVGAVGVCGTPIGTITGLLIGISLGANIVIARYIGKGDKEAVGRSVGTSILFSFLGGLFLALFGILCAEPILRWMNCDEALIPQAALYFKLYFGGIPLLMVYNFTAAILRASGDSQRPMVYLTLGGVVKVVFTYVFARFFHMGVTGVAFATILSWVLLAYLGLQAVSKSGGTVQLYRRHLKLYSHELKEILRFGVPAGLQQAMYSVANMVIVSTVNTFGLQATTGLSVANNFDGILYQVACAPSYAVVPYVSQNLGNKNLARVKEAIIKGCLLTICMGATFGFLSAFFSRELSSIMTADPVAIEFSRQKMIIVSSTYFICGLNEIIGSSLRGLGRPSLAAVCTMIYMCILRFVWVYAVYPFLPQNLTFLYLVWPVGWVLSGITLICFYFPTMKKLKKKIAAENAAV